MSYESTPCGGNDAGASGAMLWILAGNIKVLARGPESCFGKAMVRTSTLMLPAGTEETKISWLSLPVTSIPTKAVGTVHMTAL